MTIVRRAMLILAFLIPGAVVASPATAAARHYDCSKAGNANKAACKSTSAASTAAKATPAHTTTTKTTTTRTTRHYDCTKVGNANKAACRTASAHTPTGRSPGAVKTTTKTISTTTDCGKWYNRLRSACRTSKASSGPTTTVAPAPKPATAAPSSRSSTSAQTNNPRGATAQCKDGTYSHAVSHRGACSHHRGVAKWLS